MASSGWDLVRPEDYPGLFQAADQASTDGQKSYLRALRLQLSLAVLAAASAAFTVRIGDSRTDIAAVITALAFVCALAVDVAVLQRAPGKSWYEGRALAESVKTLSWRYAIAAQPFPRTMPDDEADKLFVDRVSLIQRDLPAVAIQPTTAPAITDRMRRLRHAPLNERREAYLHNRITDQQFWYATKAQYHRRRAGRLQALVLMFEVVGVAGALAKAFGVVDFDLAGIIAATVAALAAWSTARQHSSTATAYVIASHELSVISELLRNQQDEQRWATAASDAEEAISREHTLWRASHAGI
ncbi:DUF4231 domain-containing protein [Nocardia sp. N2S4-5]|uniref:DUF4231 domain-containing protein n=1 Tax=Nocardia sp. N2S4-5 TaxID=3351565 RepID=UPI0037D96D74